MSQRRATPDYATDLTGEHDPALDAEVRRAMGTAVCGKCGETVAVLRDFTYRAHGRPRCHGELPGDAFDRALRNAELAIVVERGDCGNRLRLATDSEIADRET